MTDFALTDRDRVIVQCASQHAVGLMGISKQCAYAGLPLVGHALRTRIGTLVAHGYLREEATVIPGGERVVLYMRGERTLD